MYRNHFAHSESAAASGPMLQLQSLSTQISRQRWLEDLKSDQKQGRQRAVIQRMKLMAWKLDIVCIEKRYQDTFNKHKSSGKQLHISSIQWHPGNHILCTESEK